MPKPGPAYPITTEWRRQVRKAINDLIAGGSDEDVDSDATFAKKAKIAKSSLSEALKPTSIQSAAMPQINEALGWPRPRVLSTPDELELWAAVEQLDDRELGRMLGMAESKVSELRKRRSQRS